MRQQQVKSICETKYRITGYGFGQNYRKTLFMRSGEKKPRYNNLINAKTNPIRTKKMLAIVNTFFVFGNKIRQRCGGEKDKRPK